MRLFLAVDLPSSVKKQLAEQLREIKQEYPQFNWVSENNFHITVLFYGEIDKVEKIIKKIKDVLYDQESFYMYSTDVNLFISEKIIIYLNFKREKKLEELEKKVKNVFINEFNDTNKFIPHLSLARYKKPSKQQYFVLKKRLGKLFLNISFPVKKITLFESILAGKIPTYKKITQFPLLLS